MRSLIATAVYYLLSVLLFPVQLIGYVIWAGGGILMGRGSGVSGTAQGPLSARFFEHRLGTREDDYVTTEPLESRDLYWRYARAGTKAAGEPFRFGIDSTPPSRDRLAELLQSCGLALAEQHTLGQETEGKRAWGGFAVATVQ